MAATDEMVGIARELLPDMVTLVPEKRQELTTEGGLDVSGDMERIARVVKSLRDKGIEVSLFVDAQRRQIESAKSTGADTVEIHTGHYSDAADARTRQDEFGRIKEAVGLAKNLSLRVNAGHGLHYHNTREIAAIPEIDELSIGHSIIARAVFVGLDQAVRDMLTIIHGK
jgi:pyridoxine 5-phosphate synthase